MPAQSGVSAPSTLIAALREIFGDQPVDQLERLTGGASRTTWRCRVGGRVYVAQCQRPGAQQNMVMEAAVLTAAARAGVPVPQVVGCVAAEDGAMTLVTRFVAGETIARKILRDERFVDARRRLTGQLARALAALHRIPPESVEGLTPSGGLDQMRDQYDELGEPHPAFELAFRWLTANRPAHASQPRVVHGDFRMGNIIVNDDGLAAVIDWELATVGDPLADLGWLCVPAWRFGSAAPVAGVGSREELIAAYVEASGTPVDVATLRWWEVVGILRWGIICIAQANTYRLGLVPSHELAAIGRRVCETEHDLFLALEGRW